MLDFFQSSNLFNLYFKAFAVVLSLIYLIYAIVIFRQTQIMTRTLITKGNSLIVLISFLQILVAILLIFLSFAII